MKVKSIDFVAKGKAEFREVEADIGALAPDQVLLKTDCTLISPGTEFACISGTDPSGSSLDILWHCLYLGLE